MHACSRRTVALSVDLVTRLKLCGPSYHQREREIAYLEIKLEDCSWCHEDNQSKSDGGVKDASVQEI